MDTPQPEAGRSADEDVEEIKSLSDLEESPLAKAPAPIVLVWPGKTKRQSITIFPRYPEGDLWAFQVAYLQLAEKARTPEIGKDGLQSYPHEGCELEYLRKQTIADPVYLHQKGAFEQFARSVPPYIVSSLHDKLRQAMGMDVGFFESFSRFMTPAVSSRPTAASPSASASSPQTSNPESPSASSPPSTTGPVVEVLRNGSSG